ncbi:DNA sulfur modification protein DndB [Serinicoccus sediminis]|uniref:DNA sulfur modification protein DndB n=1 Tax=Serinicoccus sediminis TaxID=2306021 RepID=UPI00101ECC73|nr:DNA sulfur modification protein DndB [Serinicoccus sediminis]
MKINVPGFLDTPKVDASGQPYVGRLLLRNVQWTDESDLFGTVTVTLEQVADAAEGRLLWTDQAVQRGLQPTAPKNTARELPLSDGYPDAGHYIFDARNADDMTEKLLANDQLFLSPLVWNLRPGTFEAYWNEETSELHLYNGKIYLPDSHHRHQAILKAMRAYRDHETGYPKFRPGKQLKVELYLLDQNGEGDYFFDKNQRPKPTALSKAYDLTSSDDLSMLAKRVLEENPDLDRGTNRVTDRLGKKAPHFVTLSTLREAMRTFAGGTEVTETEMEGLASIAAEFFTMLAQVRPELRASTPQSDRDGKLASAGVMFHAYAHLMRDYQSDIASLGPRAAKNKWSGALSRLAPESVVKVDQWTGDFFDVSNPEWQDSGITRLNRNNRLTVLNTGGARTAAAGVLRRRVRAESNGTVGM